MIEQSGLEWLRGVIEGDKASAERREGPSVWWDDDTIARCEAELALIKDYEQFRDDPAFGPTQRTWTMLGIGTAVRHIASGYKNRPGYTEDWKP